MFDKVGVKEHYHNIFPPQDNHHGHIHICFYNMAASESGYSVPEYSHHFLLNIEIIQLAFHIEQCKDDMNIHHSHLDAPGGLFIHNH